MSAGDIGEGARGGPAALAAGTMSADEEELKVPEEMFKDVKFFVVGDIDPKVPGHPPPRPFPQLLLAPPPPGGGALWHRPAPPPPSSPPDTSPRGLEVHAHRRRPGKGTAGGVGGGRTGARSRLRGCVCEGGNGG